MIDDISERRLGQFIDRYSPEVAGLAREALARLRERLRGAVQLVYDNYNALVVGFGPTERAGDAVFSIALYPRWINLYFLNGAGLPDPKKLLKGNGKQVRHITLEDAAELDLPAVKALMAAALKRAGVRVTGKAPGPIVIKAVSGKQRPRRPSP
jgi:hypothetical protein